MDGKQLKLPFDVQIQAALTTPKTSSVKSLWALLESQLCDLSDEGQLQTGAQAIAQLALLVEAKADELFDEWEQRYFPPLPDEPILNTVHLTGVLRQSMQLNLESALQPYTPHCSPRERSPSIQSVVQEMPKGDLLDLIAEETLTYEQAIAVAHDEDVSAWIKAIVQYLHYYVDQERNSIRLIDLQCDLNRPLVEIWLGLLLGNIGSLSQTNDDFYATHGVYISNWIGNATDFER